MSKNYSTAPLPFQGQKRRFIKHLKDVLKNYNADAIYVDLFGGSGLLSHNIKQFYPNATVVYNDFDNYRKRLEMIPKTNELLELLRGVLNDHPRKSRVIGTKRQQALEILKKADDDGYNDWITISASLRFSMNYATSYQDFETDTIYNRVRKTNYNADDYLKGVKVVSVDYKVLFDKYKNHDNVVFIVDPPYLSTDTTTYSSGKYWKLTDYLEILEVINGSNYVYFTSNKSSIVELCEWFGSTTLKGNPFDKAGRIDLNVGLNHTSTYTDTMLFKWNSTSTNDV